MYDQCASEMASVFIFQFMERQNPKVAVKELTRCKQPIQE
jgi:hypothetical protein